MAIHKREMRIRRQKLDDGADSDTVYIAVGSAGGESSNSYHDDPNCTYLPDGDDRVNDKSRATAQQAWKKPCSHCVLRDGFGQRVRCPECTAHSETVDGALDHYEIHHEPPTAAD